MNGIAVPLILGAIALAALTYVGSIVLIAHRFTRTRRKLPRLQQEYPALDDQRVHFAARDGRARIDAWYLSAKPRQAAVILVHGKDACRGNRLKSPPFALAERLHGAGISVLMIDLRGHGTSSGARLSYGLNERHDVLGAVDYLRERGYAPGRIGVLGASMGAATSLMAAADEPAIAAVVADSAFADFHEMIGRQYARLSGLPWWLLPGALAVSRLWTGVDLREVRPLACMKALRGRPVLVIHSEGDRLVPACDATALAHACGGECWRTDSSSHLGAYRAEPQAYAHRVLQFFLRHLEVAAAREDAANAPDMRVKMRLVA